MLGEAVTCSSDIYSFGIVCLELITGAQQHRGFYSDPRYACYIQIREGLWCSTCLCLMSMCMPQHYMLH